MAVTQNDSPYAERTSSANLQITSISVGKANGTSHHIRIPLFSITLISSTEINIQPPTCTQANAHTQITFAQGQLLQPELSLMIILKPSLRGVE